MWWFTLRLCIALPIALIAACASDDDRAALSLVLQDDSVEGGDPVFVTFEVGDQPDGTALTISPALRLRREGRDLHVLIPRSAGFDGYAAINGPATSPPPGTLQAGTQYQFQVPDAEPGFHDLCGQYSIGGTAGEACAELALG